MWAEFCNHYPLKIKEKDEFTKTETTSNLYVAKCILDAIPDDIVEVKITYKVNLAKELYDIERLVQEAKASNDVVEIIEKLQGARDKINSLLQNKN